MPYIIKTKSSSLKLPKVKSKDTAFDPVAASTALKTRLSASKVPTDTRNWFEKATNLPTDQKWYWDALELADRLTGAPVRAAIGGEGSLGKRVIGGISGKQKVSGQQLYKKLRPTAGGKESFVGGLATEMLLDPTTFLTLGAGAAAKGATTAAKGLKAAEAVGDVAKATSLASKAARLEKTGKILRETSRIAGLPTDIVMKPITVPLKQSAKFIGKQFPEVTGFAKDVGEAVTRRFNKKKFLETVLPETAADVSSKKGLLEFGKQNYSKSIKELEKSSFDEAKNWQKNLNKTVSSEIHTPIGKQIVEKTYKDVLENANIDINDTNAIAEFIRKESLKKQTTKPIITEVSNITHTLADKANEGKISLMGDVGKESEALVESLKKVVDAPEEIIVSKHPQGLGISIDIGKNNIDSLSKFIKEDDLTPLFQNELKNLKLDPNITGILSKPAIGIEVLNSPSIEKLGEKYAGTLGFAKTSAKEAGLKAITKLEDVKGTAYAPLQRIEIEDKLGLGKILGSKKQAFINTQLKGGNPDLANKFMGEMIFETDPLKILNKFYNKFEQHAIAETAIKGAFTEGLNTGAVIPLKEMTSELAKKGNYITLEGKEIASKLKLSEIFDEEFDKDFLKNLRNNNFAIDKDVYTMLEGFKPINEAKDVLTKGMDSYLKYWKGANLLSPLYHMGNNIGNIANLYLGGMPPKAVFEYSGKAMNNINKIKREIFPAIRKIYEDKEFQEAIIGKSANYIDNLMGKKLGAKNYEIYKEFSDVYRSGVLSSTKTTDALFDQIKNINKSGNIPQNVLDTVLDVNYKMSAATDEVYRYAAYKWAKENPVLAKQFGVNKPEDFVYKTLFDYSNITPNEANKWRKIFPFYNFAKNNAIFQVQNFMTNPGRYKNIKRIYDNWQSASGLEKEDIPKYAEEDMYLPIPGPDGKLKLLKIKPPITEGLEFWQLKNIAAATNPIIQFMMETAFNKDVFTGQAINKYPGDYGTAKNFARSVLPGGNLVTKLATGKYFKPTIDTTIEKARTGRAYDELTRLQGLQKKYETEQGEQLPTLKDLGLSKTTKKLKIPKLKG